MKKEDTTLRSANLDRHYLAVIRAVMCWSLNDIRRAGHSRHDLNNLDTSGSLYVHVLIRLDRFGADYTPKEEKKSLGSASH
jgi:hypothetical protein